MSQGIESYDNFVTLKIMGDGTATVAHANMYDIQDTSFPTAFGEGSAVREPGDKNDDVTAAGLAAGRALESLGRRIVKQANGRIRHADSNKAHAAEIAAKRAAVDPEWKVIPLSTRDGESFYETLIRALGGSIR